MMQLFKKINFQIRSLPNQFIEKSIKKKTLNIHTLYAHSKI